MLLRAALRLCSSRSGALASAVVPSALSHEHVFLCCRLYMYGKAAAEVGVPARNIAQLLAVFACNNHTICNTELQPLGVALTPARAVYMNVCVHAD